LSLSAALNAARSSLTANASQTAVISRNIAGVGDPSYARKVATLVTIQGGVGVGSIERAADNALFESMLNANSANASQDALATGLAQLETTAGDPADGRSVAAMLGSLTTSLQQYAAAPNNTALAQAVLAGADALAGTLNDATATVQGVRAQADGQIATSVARINTLLGQVQELNGRILPGTRAGADVTDDLDSRDALVKQLSAEIGISVIRRPDNDIAIYTDGGATLFERSARTVTFDRTMSFSATSTGRAVVVDGVPVTGPLATMPIKSGRLSGLTALRDEVAVKYQGQLDEVARGLIQSFAESDQSALPTKPLAAGLFTYSGAPTVPGSALVNGLAGDIRVNPNADPAQGGSLHRLRDGGISNPSDPAYVYNRAGAASFAGRLDDILDKLSSARAFDARTGGSATGTLMAFASSSVSWLEAGRKTAAAEADYKRAFLDRSSEALSNAQGVSLDDEMAKMLSLEHSYQASAKLMSTVDQMLAALLQAA
jgi:flagellar hook-associated protein 1 FlgK